MSDATCGGCDTRWTSLTQCHCTACHRQFRGIKGFDLHRQGITRRVCVDPSTLDRETADGRVRALYLVDGVWGDEESPAKRNTDNLRIRWERNRK